MQHSSYLPPSNIIVAIIWWIHHCYQKLRNQKQLKGTMFAEWCKNGNKLFSANFDSLLFTFA